MDQKPEGQAEKTPAPCNRCGGPNVWHNSEPKAAVCQKCFVELAGIPQPSNETAMKKVIVTGGPCPAAHVAEVVIQSEIQGWTVRFVAFAGMGVLQGITLKQEPIALYYVWVEKLFPVTEENPKPPVLRLSGGKQ